MLHTPAPMKLRLRSRKTEGAALSEHPTARKRIIKRAPPARGPNKRRRSAEDEMGREDDDVESDLDIYEKGESDPEAAEELLRGRQHPKRSRIAPEALPFGLEGTTSMRCTPMTLPARTGATWKERMSRSRADGAAWTAEDDRILVEPVLEKLKLSKSDWQDCARSLGKDRGSVGRRWKSLMLNGDVGIKRTSRRSKIHGTWR